MPLSRRNEKRSTQIAINDYRTNYRLKSKEFTVIHPKRRHSTSSLLLDGTRVAVETASARVTRGQSEVIRA